MIGSAESLDGTLLIVDGLNASWHSDPAVFRHLVEGRVTAVNATVAANHDTAWTVTSIGRVLEHIRRNRDQAMLVQSAADITTAQQGAKVGYVLGLQDTVPLGDDPVTLDAFYQAGIRVIQLTYNFDNLVGCGCQCPTDTGLTPFGRDLIRRLNERGILIDLSHCGVRTAAEAIDVSNKPVALTHANLTTTLDHPRNKPPEIVRAVADAGGVIGAVAFPALVTKDPSPSVGHYLQAIDDLVQLVGAEHVGIGPDFMEAMPAEVAMSVLKGLPKEAVQGFSSVKPMSGLSSPADYPGLADALQKRGYTAAEVRAIMGGNWVELYRKVWDPIIVDYGTMQ